MSHPVDLTGALWLKSSHSQSGGACVEVALGFISGSVPVRDSKDPDGSALVFPAAEFEAFVGAVKVGEFAEGERYVGL